MIINLTANKRWLLLAAPATLALAFLIALLMSVSTTTIQAAPATPSSAHVVVQFANGDTAVRPITWTGTISRVAALKSAGFEVKHSGDTVCSIDGEGCPSADCFCSANRWAQGQWANTAWDTTAWPPPPVSNDDVIAFRNGAKADYSDWGLTGQLPAAPVYVAAADALEWMRDQQQSDGSYNDGFSRVGASVRALIALGASGYDPAQWGAPSLLDFLTVVSKTETVQYAAASAGGAAKLAIGAAWSGQTVTNFAGINLPISITAYYSPATGGYGAGSGDTAWAVLGLYAAGESIPTSTVAFFKRVQNADGGWAWNEWSANSAAQHTATCIQALLAAGEPITATQVVSALAFIDSAHNADGGYGSQTGKNSDIDTTAFALQAILSAGKNPAGNWCATLRCRYVLSEQAADGSFSFNNTPSLYATQETIPALMHRPFGPLAQWSYNCYTGYMPLIVKGAAP